MGSPGLQNSETVALAIFDLIKYLPEEQIKDSIRIIVSAAIDDWNPPGFKFFDPFTKRIAKSIAIPAIQWFCLRFINEIQQNGRDSEFFARFRDRL